MPTPRVFKLLLSSAEQKALKEAYQALHTSVERRIRLQPQMLEGLQAKMRKHLFDLEGFEEIYQDAVTNHYTVHLVHPDNEILNLPWRLAVEDRAYLYLTKGPGEKAELSDYIPHIPLPLKILVMVSAPEDVSETGRLDYEGEEKRILAAFEDLFDNAQVQVDFTDDGSLEGLKNKLKANRYHILHFSGHGVFSKKEDTGYLLLENERTLKKELVAATDFAQAVNIREANRPPLVLLSSCQTGQGATGEGIRGVANQLVNIGIPAVIGMGFSILDYFATSFAAKLYEQLAEKAPIHQAFATAIQHIKTEEGKHIQIGNLRGFYRGEHALPSQWLIPQLYASAQVDQLVDWNQVQETVTYSSSKFITGKERLLLEAQQNYLFVGRRKERRDALKALEEEKAVLLLGQGGVGKTSLAEHILSRLMAEDSKVYPFLVNEKDFNTSESLLKQIMEYLQRYRAEFLIVSETSQYEKSLDKLNFLLGKLVKGKCKPVFIFDNLETFQTEPGKGFKPENSDIEEYLKALLHYRTFPLILTSRYPLSEEITVPQVNLNEVGYGDFFRKCQQLTINERRGLDSSFKRSSSSKTLGEEGPVTFPLMVQLLHQTLGGNYRALEFFDQVYQEKKEKISDTLQRLSDFRDQLEQESKQEVVEKLRTYTRKLVFEELTDLLQEEERKVLDLLAQFRIPVLPLALEMQQVSESLLPVLQRLQDLTLIEAQTVFFEKDHEGNYYYVPPLVEDFLRQQEAETVLFSHEQAGSYYQSLDKEINHQTYSDLEEAFWHFCQTTHNERIKEIGGKLCRFYSGKQIFTKALFYGINVEQKAGETTPAIILNEIGFIFDIFGKYDAALAYYQRAQKAYSEIGDRQGEGTTLNNISQIYAYAKGDYDTALDYLEQSLKIQQEIGDRQGEGATLNNISQIYDAKG